MSSSSATGVITRVSGLNVGEQPRPRLVARGQCTDCEYVEAFVKRLGEGAQHRAALEYALFPDGNHRTTMEEFALLLTVFPGLLGNDDDLLP